MLKEGHKTFGIVLTRENEVLAILRGRKKVSSLKMVGGGGGGGASPGALPCLEGGGGGGGQFRASHFPIFWPPPSP